MEKHTKILLYEKCKGDRLKCKEWEMEYGIWCLREYMGLAMAGQEVSYLRGLQIKMKGATAVPKPVRLFLDNQLAIVYNPVYHPRTKQILAKFHFILNEKELTVENFSAAQMGVDMLTKHAIVGIICYNKKILGMF